MNVFAANASPILPWQRNGDHTNSALSPLKQSLFAIMWAIVLLRVFTYENSLFNRNWCHWLLAKIGLISYALYMYHQTINGLIHGLFFNQEPSIKTFEHLLAAIAVLAIAIRLATLSYVYFERQYVAMVLLLKPDYLKISSKNETDVITKPIH